MKCIQAHHVKYNAMYFYHYNPLYFKIINIIFSLFSWNHFTRVKCWNHFPSVIVEPDSKGRGRDKNLWLRCIVLWQPSVLHALKEVHLQNASGPVGWRAHIRMKQPHAVGWGQLNLDGRECEAVHQTTRHPHERRTLTPHTSLTRTIWVTCLFEEFFDVVLVCVEVEDIHNVLDEKRTLAFMSIRHRVCRIEWKDN